MEGSSPRSDRRWYAAALAVLLLAAAATRFVGLSRWPLWGDEFFTLRDTSAFSFSLLRRPLLFWLNHYLVLPFLPLDATSARLLPALFGVAGVGVVAEAGRRLVSRKAGLVAGALTVLSPWHLEMSQFARYYTLIFLLSALAPTALYLAVREKSRGWLVAGVAATGLAWLAHPTAVLPVAGFLLWLVGYAVLRTGGDRRRQLLGGIGLVAVAGGAAGLALLSRWSSLGQDWGIGGPWVALSYVVRLGAGPALAAAGGVALLWLDGRRELALFLASAVAVPLVAVAVLGELVSVHTGYLFATAPFALLAAGAFVDGTMRATEGRSRARVAGAGTLALVVVTGAPSFVSHYRDGGRPDFRAAARHVAARAGPSDVVLADDRGPFVAYAPELDARRLSRDTARLDSLRAAVSGASPPGDLWVVPYLHTEGGFGIAGLGEARRWVWGHCRLDARFDPVRIDRVRNIAEVWRCGGEGTP